MKLGRIRPEIPPDKDPRFLHLRDFVLSPSYRGLISAPLPVPPASSDRDGNIPPNGWGVLGNDKYGDCVLAGEAHYWMANSAVVSGSPIKIDEAALIRLYFQLSPKDQGLVISDVLDLEQDKGILGQEIIGYVALDPRMDLIKLAVHEFGGVKLGIDLPASAQAQFNANKPWTVVPMSPVVGGHDIEGVGYDKNYLYCVTWGRLVPVAWAWLAKYWGEGFARISPLWLGKSGTTPTGLDTTALLDALSQMGKGPKPDVPPAPVPVPPPQPPPPPEPKPDPPPVVVPPPAPVPVSAGGVSIDIDRKLVTAPKGWAFTNS